MVSIAEAVSLGIIEPPRQADIVAMEAQSFGVPLGFGGPYCGVIATQEKFVRQMPGRLAGQTTDRNGKRGFVLTLATREQELHLQRFKERVVSRKGVQTLIARAGWLLDGAKTWCTFAGKAGLVVMDCIGFRRKTRDEIASLTGAPTLVANLLVARGLTRRRGRSARCTRPVSTTASRCRACSTASCRRSCSRSTSRSR